MSTPITMKSNGDFDKSVKEGRRGEIYFKKYYTPYVTKKGLTLVDVAADWDWRGKDVDFLVKNGDDLKLKLEVKIDKRSDGYSLPDKDGIIHGPTGNLLYEYVTHNKMGEQKDGWTKKTDADYAIFILGDCNYKEKYLELTRLVWVDVKKWREYKDTHPSKLWVKKELDPKSNN